MRLSNRGANSLEPRERSIPRLEKELGVDQLRQKPITLGPVEAPEPLRLRRRQTHPWHLQELALNSLE
jgi:hypothetical protein